VHDGGDVDIPAAHFGDGRWLLHTWRRKAMPGELPLAPPPVATPGFAPVRVGTTSLRRVRRVADDDTAAGMMVIELPGERRIHIRRAAMAAGRAD
jgi:hypothetical protein